MAVTDLTNTVWTFNDIPDFTDLPSTSSLIFGTAENAQDTYKKFSYGSGGSFYAFSYVNSDNDAIMAYREDTQSWVSGMKTIYISGGTDVTNTDLISWLQATAVQQINLLKELFQDIADAIRTKNGSSSLYYPLQMPNAILAIPTSGTINNQNKVVTPTKSIQNVTFDSGYTGLGTVTVNAIPNQYIIPTGTIEISNNGTVDVTQYASASVSVGSAINNQNKTVTPTESTQSITYDSGYTGLGIVTVNAISSTYIGSDIPIDPTPTASGATVTIPTGYYSVQTTKSVSTTTHPNPTVSIATNGLITASHVQSSGYVTGSTTTNTLQLTARTSSDLTTSGATVTAPAGYYDSSASASVTTMTLPTSASSSATSGYTSKATIGRSTSAQYINIPPGYNSAGGYYLISATPNGSATGPSTLSGTSATVSTGSNTLTLTKTGVTTTPTVSAGYISSATASTATVTLTASVTTKSAATYYPSTTQQSISASQYLTGAQTIAAVTTTNLTANNIVNGVVIKVGDSSDNDRIASVTGNVVLQNYYTGSSTPSNSLGQNGDLYLQT